MSDEEREAFEQIPYFEDGLILRRWDDLAKVKGVGNRKFRDLSRHRATVSTAKSHGGIENELRSNRIEIYRNAGKRRSLFNTNATGRREMAPRTRTRRRYKYASFNPPDNRRTVSRYRYRNVPLPVPLHGTRRWR